MMGIFENITGIIILLLTAGSGMSYTMSVRKQAFRTAGSGAGFRVPDALGFGALGF